MRIGGIIIAMGKRLELRLSVKDRDALLKIVKRGENWKERERAETLLLLDEDNTLQTVSDMLGINIKTVSSTRSAWLKEGLTCLSDKQRSGAPHKLSSADVRNIQARARAEPLSAKQILDKHVERGGKRVHFNTIINTLKSSGMVWKRTRHSLKKKEMKVLSVWRKGK
jgi:transposase